MPGTARPCVPRLPDDALERGLTALVAAESEATADVVEYIAEFEQRKLFAPKSFPSMFEYCTKVFGYSEGAAYLRIYAGRLSREYPEILELLRARRLHLTAIRTVGPHLKPWNHRLILDRSLSKSERELKFLVAEFAHKPEPEEVIRRLPPAGLRAAESAPKAPEALSRPPEPEVVSPNNALESPQSEGVASPPALAVAAATASLLSFPSEQLVPPEVPRPGPIVVPSPAREKIEPLSARRVRFGFTGTDVFLGNVDRVRQLLRHKYPAGALEDILREVIDHYLKSKDPSLKKNRFRPRKGSPRRRTVSAWVKSVVFERDDGRCAFVASSDGRRCEERGGLEYDHIVPWALGGASDDPGNIRLLCRGHNAFVAEQVFGLRRTQRSKRPMRRKTANVAAKRDTDSQGLDADRSQSAAKLDK